MTLSYRNLTAFAILAMAISVSSPALAQEKQPAGGPQPSPSAPGPNGNQATNAPAPSGAAPSNQGGAQSTPGNNSTAGQPPTPAADHEVQTVRGDLVPGYDPIMMVHTETVTTRLEIQEKGEKPGQTGQYKLVRGFKDDGTPYAYVESPQGKGFPLREVEVVNGESRTTMYAFEQPKGTGSLFENPFYLIAVAPDAKTVKRARNDEALIKVFGKQGGQPQPPPDQKNESPQGQNRQGGQPAPRAGSASGSGSAKAAKVGALEDNGNKNNNKSDSNKSDSNKSENHTEQGPAGHSSKPATTPTKPQQAVAAGEAGKSHETRLDESAAHTNSKPATPSTKAQQAAKLTGFDTSHMGLAAKVQSFAKPPSTTNRALATQH